MFWVLAPEEDMLETHRRGGCSGDTEWIAGDMSSFSLLSGRSPRGEHGGNMSSTRGQVVEAYWRIGCAGTQVCRSGHQVGVTGPLI